VAPGSLTSLTGTVSVRVANETSVVDERDVLAFRGGRDHVYKNVGTKRTECVQLATIARFGALIAQQAETPSQVIE
jgi:uncharacterized cupin superfamily protein